MLLETRIAFFSNTFVFAILAGSLCVVCSSAIDDLFVGSIVEKSGINLKSIAIKCIISGATAGPLLGIIFYAFSRTDSEPIKTSFIYATLFGIVAPILYRLIFVFYLKLFPQKPNN
jgi:hypothetical protein